MNAGILDKLNIKIMSPDKVIFEGFAKALSCNNAKGPMDILPGHSNFMSMINNEISLHLDNGVVKKLTTEQAIMEVVNNNVLILTNVQF